MNETKTANGINGNGAGAPEESKQFVLQNLYVKDMSFESPSSPQIFQGGNIEPETELNMRSGHAELSEGLYEVKLNISVHAKQDDQTIFLVELEQAGVFQVVGYKIDEIHSLLGIHCPATLFPYARETISSIVSKGGFPPLMLQPISFDALYARARVQRNAQTSGSN